MFPGDLITRKQFIKNVSRETMKGGNMVNLIELGKQCKAYRIEQGFYQVDVARDTGYSIENISAFETGRNDNAKILMWYIQKGFEYTKEGVNV